MSEWERRWSEVRALKEDDEYDFDPFYEYEDEEGLEKTGLEELLERIGDGSLLKGAEEALENETVGIGLGGGGVLAAGIKSDSFNIKEFDKLLKRKKLSREPIRKRYPHTYYNRELRLQSDPITEKFFNAKTGKPDYEKLEDLYEYAKEFDLNKHNVPELDEKFASRPDRTGKVKMSTPQRYISINPRMDYYFRSQWSSPGTGIKRLIHDYNDYKKFGKDVAKAAGKGLKVLPLVGALAAALQGDEAEAAHLLAEDFVGLGGLLDTDKLSEGADNPRGLSPRHGWTPEEEEQIQDIKPTGLEKLLEQVGDGRLSREPASAQTLENIAIRTGKVGAKLMFDKEMEAMVEAVKIKQKIVRGTATDFDYKRYAQLRRIIDGGTAAKDYRPIKKPSIMNRIKNKMGVGGGGGAGKGALRIVDPDDELR